MGWETGDYATAAAGAISGVSSAVAQYSMGVQDRKNAEIERAWNSDEAAKARLFNHTEAENAREYSRVMSNTAYRRSREDMEAAGLNPIMMAGQGGASTPSPSQGSGSAAGGGFNKPSKAPDMGDAISKTISTSLDMSRFKKEMEAKDAAISLDKAATLAQVANAKNTTVSAANAELAGKKMGYELPASKSEAELKKSQADWDKSAVPFDNIMKRVGQSVGIISNAMNPLDGFRKMWGDINGPSKSGDYKKGQHDLIRKQQENLRKK